MNKLLTFPLLKRNNVHEDFLVILQFDWLSKTLFTLCIKWPLYHCLRYHGRFTDFIRGNCCILFDPPVKNIFQLTRNTLGEGIISKCSEQVNIL